MRYSHGDTERTESGISGENRNRIKVHGLCGHGVRYAGPQRRVRETARLRRAALENRVTRTNDQPIAELDGTLDTEFAHAGLQSGALHAEDGGGAARTSYAPLRLLENLEDVLALGIVESLR